MSTWTTPATWVNGAVTATQMNTEIRDHLNFLKGALDLLTNSTAADTGTTMYLQIRRTASTDTVFEGQVGAEANPRIRILASGKITMGPGGATAPDTTLAERVSPAIIKMSGDSQYRNEWAAANNNVYFAGRAAADTNDRISMRTDGSGRPFFNLGDGTTSQIVRLLYDPAVPSTHLVYGTSLNLESSLGGNDGLKITANTVTFMGTGTDVAFDRLVAGTLRTQQRLQVSPESIAIHTEGGPVSDSSFAVTAEPGLIALDNVNLWFYARMGAAWFKTDMNGDTSMLGPYSYTNLAASQTNLEADIAAIGINAGTPRITIPFPGSIVGMTVRGSASVSAGSATFRPAVAGSPGTLNVVLASGNVNVSGTQDPLVDTFDGSQGISVMVTTTAAFAPTTTEYVIFLFVNYHRA